MSGINILFYSRACETCHNLLSLLQNENLLCNFKLFCVDERLNELPPYITVVPTMIIANINKPLVAKETFEWIQQIKFLRHNQQTIMEMNKKIIQQNLINLAKNSTDGPIGFHDMEMGSLSDKFAFKDIDEPLTQSFFGLGDDEKNAIFTAPEQPKLSKDEQKRRIDEAKNRRDIQAQEFGKIMKQDQIKAVIDAENQNQYTR